MCFRSFWMECSSLVYASARALDGFIVAAIYNKTLPRYQRPDCALYTFNAGKPWQCKA